MTEIAVRLAAPADLDGLTELFDAYRSYYDQAADPARARAFLKSRLELADSVILLAELTGAGPGGLAGRPIGFSQLYPSFSSVSTARIWILNDLYVAAAQRRRGVAAALLEAARRHAVQTGAVRLVLETLPANAPAQALYEKSGWARDETWHYLLDLTPSD